MLDSYFFSKQRSFLFLIFLCLSVSSFFIPQVLGEDPGTALAAWRSMRQGAPFNTIKIPDPQNLSNSIYLFLTWWTPGQYLLPGWLSQLGMSLGLASLIVTIVFSALGLWGWYCVYRLLKIDYQIIFFCLLMMVTSRLFTINFINYTGGEVLIFGTQPWSIYALLKWQKKPIFLFISLLLISLACFFCKSSYTIGLAAVGVCAGLFWLQTWQQPAQRRKAFTAVVAVALCCGAYLLLTQWGFLKRGANPTSSQGSLGLNIGSYELLNYPLLQWFSIVDLRSLISRYFQNLETVNVWFHVVSVAGILPLWYVVWRSALTPLKTIFLGFSITYLGIFLYFFNTGADISLEYRHLKILAFLFLPLLCQYAWHRPVAKQVVLVLFLIGNSLYGLSIYALKKWEVEQKYVVGKTGYAIKDLSASDLAFIHSKDVPEHPERIWFFVPTSPNVEVKYGRKMLSGFNFEASKIGQYVYDGYASKSEKIYCVLHRAFDSTPNHPAPSVMFPNYRFEVVKSSQEMLIYEGTPSETPPTID
jgi:hypothetical protein